VSRGLGSVANFEKRQKADGNPSVRTILTICIAIVTTFDYIINRQGEIS